MSLEMEEILSKSETILAVTLPLRAKSCAIMEYLGAEVSEQERQRDMDANPHLSVWQTFTFDHVYDQNST
jgi:hypothetical protein